MPALTLLVPLHDPGTEVDGLVASLDAQSAPRDAFEVVLVDAASSDGTSDRLARLAAARPNVTHLPVAAGTDLHARVAEGLERASGDRVAVLRPEQRLTGDAVALLTGAGTEAGQAVLGRAVSDGADDGLPLADGRTEVGVTGAALVAVPREALASAADPAAALLAGDPLGRDVVAVGSAACLAGSFASAGTDLLGDTSAAWVDGRLELRTTLPGVPADARAWLVLARSDATAEVLVPAVVAADGPATSVRALVDVRDALGGRPLDDGLWAVRLRVRAGSADGTAPVVCPSPGPAVVDGRLVSTLVDPAGLVLDVGATTIGVVGRLPVADATIEQSARGALLVLACRRLHVSGDAVLPIAVLLGRFRLRAELRCEDGAASVHCWASGLAGRSRIAVQAGGRRGRRTGLDLVIDGTGRMSVLRTPKPREPVAPAVPAHDGFGVVRRHLPEALVPVARRVARTPAGRRLRRLVGGR